VAKKKRQVEEEHENHERWLVTYADMLTLLMVLFVVLFAMSTVDQKKFNALKAGLAAGFGQTTSVLDGSSSILSEPGTAPVAQIAPSQAQEAEEIEEIKMNAATEALAQQHQRAYAEAEGEADRLGAIEKRLKRALEEAGLADDVTTKIDGRGLTVSMVSRHVVFQANLATFSPRGRRIVDVLAPVLAEVEDRLHVEGHTNQAPGRPKYYASDWDLAAARAITVLRYLTEQHGIAESQVAAVGYGHVKPLVDPSLPHSQELNKRVDIVVVSRLAAGDEALLERVVYDRAHGEGSGTTSSKTSHETNGTTSTSGTEEH
jgi:chemotaxis protein MotB